MCKSNSPVKTEYQNGLKHSAVSALFIEVTLKAWKYWRVEEERMWSYISVDGNWKKLL
jgi:hypothetical protein